MRSCGKHNLTHLCRPVRSTFAVRETASLGIMGAPRVPPLNPSESIVLWEHYRLWDSAHYSKCWTQRSALMGWCVILHAERLTKPADTTRINNSHQRDLWRHTSMPVGQLSRSWPIGAAAWRDKRRRWLQFLHDVWTDWAGGKKSHHLSERVDLLFVHHLFV